MGLLRVSKPNYKTIEHPSLLCRMSQFITRIIYQFQFLSYIYRIQQLEITILFFLPMMCVFSTMLRSLFLSTVLRPEVDRPKVEIMIKDSSMPPNACRFLSVFYSVALFLMSISHRLFCRFQNTSVFSVNTASLWTSNLVDSLSSALQSLVPSPVSASFFFPTLCLDRLLG